MNIERSWIIGVVNLLHLAGVVMVVKPKFKIDNSNITNSDSQELQNEVVPTSKTTTQPPVMSIDQKKTYTATLKTNQGEIVIELNAKQSPITVNNFVTLAKKDFYNKTIFHRVINGFMIQGGDPEGTGRGGPGYTIPDELGAGNKNDTGTISMANAGPDTGGSQFFINLADNNFLDDKHAVFGRVIRGMEVVEAIGKVKTDQNDRPVDEVVIQTVLITEK